MKWAIKCRRGCGANFLIARPAGARSAASRSAHEAFTSAVKAAYACSASPLPDNLLSTEDRAHCSLTCETTMRDVFLQRKVSQTISTGAHGETPSRKQYSGSIALCVLRRVANSTEVVWRRIYQKLVAIDAANRLSSYRRARWSATRSASDSLGLSVTSALSRH